MIQVFDFEQGSPEWFAARAGRPTASAFATVMSEGRADGTMPNAMIDALVKSGCSASQLAAAVKAAKSKNSNPAAMRAKYMRQLAGERITGEVVETYSNAHMDRGKAMEDEARDFYAFLNDCDPQRVGLVCNEIAACSPDSLIGDRGGLEIKTALPDIQIERLLSGKLPSEHRAQVQGNLWITERDWWDFMSYWPKMKPLIVRVPRDDAYIRDLELAVFDFNSELHDLVERLTGNATDKLREALKSSVHMAG